MDAAVQELVDSLPQGVVVTTPAALDKYRHDWTRDPRVGMPVAAVRAESAEQVQTTVRWAARHGVGVVPRGAGTSLSGGSMAVDGCVVLSLERMRAVEVDTTARVAVAEPGALNVEVKRAAGEHGLWYPPDPSSYEICSIGGNVATNAGGLCCVKYGVTTDYVLGMDVVLADGTLVTLGGPRIKDVAGLPLLKLFVGSEGTLGIVTRVVLRLLPEQQPRATVVVVHPETGTDLWTSRFGTWTALRIAVPAGLDPASFRDELAGELLDALESAAFGWAFQPVKAQGLDAASGAETATA